MVLCSSCGLQLSGNFALCPYHHLVSDEDWARVNRIMCDGIHRKKWPPRLSLAERNDGWVDPLV